MACKHTGTCNAFLANSLIIAINAAPSVPALGTSTLVRNEEEDALWIAMHKQARNGKEKTACMNHLVLSK